MLSQLNYLSLPFNQWLSLQALIQVMPEINEHMALLNAIPLTDALQRLHPDVCIKLNHLGQCPIYADEYTVFTAVSGYGREVQLCLADTPVIWARSICALDDLAWQDIMHCGTQTLGSRIYPLALKRSDFQFACLTADHACNPTNQYLLARRSTLWLAHRPLLLTETFLPALNEF